MKITLKNIVHFIEGNIKMLGEALHLLPDHEREQVLYRYQVCKDECVEYGYCVECGCSIPGKFYVTESCNGGKKFPDLMGKAEWETFKKKNNIKFEN